MSTAREAFQLLKLHPSVEGLDDSAIEEIAASAEVVRFGPGQIVFSPDQPVTSIFLVVHGRLKLQLMDLHGRVVVERFQTRGGQVGGLAAALGEPQPFVCSAEDPSVLLRLAYDTAQAIARKNDQFRTNFARLMADSVRQAILRDKIPIRPRISAFFHQHEQSRLVSQQLLRRLVQLGESPYVFTDHAIAVDGVQVHRLQNEWQEWSPENIRRKAAEWLQTGRLIFDVASTVEPALGLRGFEVCDQIFWCVTPSNWQTSTQQLRRILGQSASLREKIRVVWLLSQDEVAPVADELRELVHGDLKVCLDQTNGTRGRTIFAGIERLLHLLRGVQIGVALGGGAARGMAHIGVLKALEDAGITVDRIAGTSAGAMTGTVFCAGFSPEFMIEHFTNDLEPSRLFKMLPRGKQWYLLYKYRRGQFDPMLRKYLGSLRLEQFYVPMHSVAVDLVSGREVVRSRGDAVHSIVESINLPLLAPPINRDGEALVDGGLINNVPANVLAARGCNFIIAVSVTARMEQEFAANRPDTPLARMRRASTIQTLLRSYLVQSHSVNALGVQPADVVIEPDVTRFDLAEFARTPSLADAGEQATLAAIPQIKELLNKLDSNLFG